MEALSGLAWEGLWKSQVERGSVLGVSKRSVSKRSVSKGQWACGEGRGSLSGALKLSVWDERQAEGEGQSLREFLSGLGLEVLMIQWASGVVSTAQWDHYLRMWMAVGPAVGAEMDRQ